MPAAETGAQVADATAQQRLQPEAVGHCQIGVGVAATPTEADLVALSQGPVWPGGQGWPKN